MAACSRLRLGLIAVWLAPWGLTQAQHGSAESWQWDWHAQAGVHWSSGGPDLNDNRQLFGGTAYLQGAVRHGDVSVQLESQLQITDVEASSSLRPGHRLRQFYLDYRGENFDLRLGRQLLIWGRTDGFNPTDLISPTDYRFLTSEDQGQRFGVIAASLRWYLGESDSLVFLLSPEFRSSILPEELVPAGISEPRLVRPDDGIDDPRGGLKLEHLGLGFDYSLSVYHGFLPTPGLTFRNNELRLENAPFTLFGADWVKTWGEWALRGELAYSDVHPGERFAAGLGPQDNFFAVVGLEHPVFADDLLLVQGLYRHVFNDTGLKGLAEPQRSLALFNDIAYSQFGDRQGGVSLTLVSSFLQETLRTEISAGAYLGPFNSVLRAEAKYSLNDDWSLRGLGLWLQGPAESNFGALEDSSRVFVELRYSLH